MSSTDHIRLSPSDTMDPPGQTPREENTQGTSASGGSQPPANNPIKSAGADGSIWAPK